MLVITDHCIPRCDVSARRRRAEEFKINQSAIRTQPRTIIQRYWKKREKLLELLAKRKQGMDGMDVSGNLETQRVVSVCTRYYSSHDQRIGKEGTHHLFPGGLNRRLILDGPNKIDICSIEN